MSQGKRTPLYEVYREYGAKTIDFGGWEMPVQFSGILAEHEAVRTRAGLFDVSHMGEVVVRGKDALANIQRWITNDAARLTVGQALYSPMCREDGGCVDDLLVYKKGEEEYLLVVNAANTAKDVAWMKEHSCGEVEIRDVSAEVALLALQGPRAARILERACDAEIKGLKYYHFLPSVRVAGIPVLLSRTGYTGEDGFELYLSAEKAVALWHALMQAGEEEGVVPAGLGARDTLRLEACLPLYGHELTEEITPLEAGLAPFVRLEKGNFLGRDALAKQKTEGVPRKLVGVEMVERGVPRAQYQVQAQGQTIGVVTSGTYAPTLQKNIALALLQANDAVEGREVDVIIRGKPVRGVIVPKPFYKRKKSQ